MRSTQMTFIRIHTYIYRWNHHHKSITWESLPWRKWLYVEQSDAKRKILKSKNNQSHRDNVPRNFMNNLKSSKTRISIQVRRYEINSRLKKKRSMTVTKPGKCGPSNNKWAFLECIAPETYQSESKDSAAPWR